MAIVKKARIPVVSFRNQFCFKSNFLDFKPMDFYASVLIFLFLVIQNSAAQEAEEAAEEEEETGLMLWISNLIGIFVVVGAALVGMFVCGKPEKVNGAKLEVAGLGPGKTTGLKEKPGRSGTLVTKRGSTSSVEDKMSTSLKKTPVAKTADDESNADTGSVFSTTSTK